MIRGIFGSFQHAVVELAIIIPFEHMIIIRSWMFIGVVWVQRRRAVLRIFFVRIGGRDCFARVIMRWPAWVMNRSGGNNGSLWRGVRLCAVYVFLGPHMMHGGVFDVVLFIVGLVMLYVSCDIRYFGYHGHIRGFCDRIFIICFTSSMTGSIPGGAWVVCVPGWGFYGPPWVWEAGRSS